MSVSINPYRTYILNCYRDISDLPALNYWLYKYHVEDALSNSRPFVTKYCTFKALPVPPDGEDFGSYNWIMTEHNYLYNPVNLFGNSGFVRMRGEAKIPHFMEMTCQDPNAPLRNEKWTGTKDGFHPIVMTCAPLIWEDDLKGSGRTVYDGPYMRWLVIFKYPEGVTQEQGDDWFLNKLAPQIVDCPQVLRFVTSATYKDGHLKNPWNRVAELWFENSNTWHECMVEGSSKFVKPEWAKWDAFPYLEPYKDFVGEFLLDRPESDHLEQYKGYITAR